jgi:peptidoglycan/xylan/chitin deacetylase (PgdA/CDA1 family)
MTAARGARFGRRAFVAGMAGTAALAAASCVPTEDSSRQRTMIERTDATGPSGGGRAEPLGMRDVIWSVVTDEPVITFTFDDGPDPDFTPKVLDILASLGVKATFNVMGYNAQHHADLIHAVVAAGHEIGNHTMTHQDLAFVTRQRTFEEIRKGSDAIESIIDTKPRFFRPPRGELTGSALIAAARLEQDILLYSLLGDVAGLETPKAVRAYVEPHMAKGSIIAFHDGIGRGTFAPTRRFARDLHERRAAELRALPAILEATLEQGLQIIPAGELVDRARAR